MSARESASAQESAPVRESVPGWVTLGDAEEIVWTGRPSMLLAAGSMLLGFVLVVVGSALYGVVIPTDSGFRWVGLLVVAAGVALIILVVARHRSTQYVITTNEVYRKEGLLSRKVASLRLDRIQNVSFEQSLLERLSMYGDVYVDTAGTGGTEITFHGVPNPQRVSSMLTEQLDHVSNR